MLDVSHEVLAVSRADGHVVWRIPIDDDSINSLMPGPDGSLYVPLFGMLDLVSPNPQIEYQGGVIKLRAVQ
jgi:hypothetical protein